METSKKFYAIRCSTEEQTRECSNYKIFYYYDPTNSWAIKIKHESSWYTVISYDKAISLGLLGEKKGECLSEDKEVWTPYMDYLERKESTSEDIVELIMEEIIELLPGNYSCTRVWWAWQYWTMWESDFIPLRENEEFIEDMRNIILTSIYYSKMSDQSATLASNFKRIRFFECD